MNNIEKKTVDNPFSLALATNKDIVVALAGNPNTGKSTIFNALTGLRQHTGNWPGKTVTNAQGHYIHRGKPFLIVDLPGTYSLLANSPDEQVTRDFICFGKPDATIIVADATNLERNLNLALQVIEATDKVVLCVNLLDEAERKGIVVNLERLAAELGIPVIGTVARSQKGLIKLKDTIDDLVTGEIKTTPLKLRYTEYIESKIEELTPYLENLLKGFIDPRWVALRIIEGDNTLINSIEQYFVEKSFKIKDEAQ